MITILGSTPLTAVLGSGVDNTDHEAVRSFIHQAAGIGLHLLFVVPGSKLPADLRTPAQRRADDKAAREAARDAGRADWERVKSPSGLALATDNKPRLDRYLKAYGERYGETAPVNLAIEVGASRLLVVDCDTAAQRDHFLEVSGAPEGLPPTVITPGMANTDGDMVHADGGHYYFTLPEGTELPTTIGAYTWGAGDGAFAVLWDRRYVLIPPSTRPEGAYEMVGRDYEVPDWIVEKITEAADLRAQRYDRESSGDAELTEAIDAWADTVSWASILEPAGWSRTARPDNCGCDAWTAPGEHANPRSATAHDPGCTLGRYTETNAPLHIWTDHDIEPFGEWVAEQGTSTISKLQAVAVTEFDGSMSTAMEELNLTPDLGVSLDAADGVPASNMDADGPAKSNLDERLPSTPEALAAEVADAQAVDEPVEDADTQPAEVTAHDEGDIVTISGADLDAAPFPDEVSTDDEGVYPSSIDGLPTIAVFDYWRHTPPPEYVIEGLIEHRGLSSIIGPPGMGKSTVALDMACAIATGRRWQGRATLQTKVLYMPGEGLSGVVQRIIAWEQANNATVGDNLLIADDVIHVSAHRDAWVGLMALVSQLGVGLIIGDTFARMSSGNDENSAQDVGRAVRRIDEVRKGCNCGAVLVHHTAKGNAESGRGSSALNGALDSELLIRGGTWEYDQLGVDPDDVPRGKRIELTTTKQKNTEQLDEPLPLLMRSWDRNESVIITGPTGTVDPLASDVVLASPIPEPVIETAIRIRRHLERFTQQGLTRGDLAQQLDPDAYTLRRDDAARHWKAKVAEAVDRAIRYDLIETLTGTASGSRYIPSIGTIADARQRAADEAIGGDDDDD
ncbi:DNA primase/helicase [Gordonia phage Ligma]|nr:DNA primase/helicase [Gordonia phage Ligma]UQT02150.1 DNA helicase [Gordonia phage Axumite]